MAFDFFGDKTRAVVAIKPLQGGGAAGIEPDCITTDLGSPTNMLRLASSEGHSDLMLLVNEEFGPVPVLRRFLDPTPFPTSSDTDGARP